MKAKVEMKAKAKKTKFKFKEFVKNNGFSFGMAVLCAVLIYIIIV